MEYRFPWSRVLGSTRRLYFLWLSKVELQRVGDVVVEPENRCHEGSK